MLGHKDVVVHLPILNKTEVFGMQSVFCCLPTCHPFYPTSETTADSSLDESATPISPSLSSLCQPNIELYFPLFACYPNVICLQACFLNIMRWNESK